jgi:hypothetical protein
LLSPSCKPKNYSSLNDYNRLRPKWFLRLELCKIFWLICDRAVQTTGTFPLHPRSLSLVASAELGSQPALWFWKMISPDHFQGHSFFRRDGGEVFCHRKIRYFDFLTAAIILARLGP